MSGEIVYLGKDNFGAINTDLQPWDLPLGYFNNGYNFRVSNGALKTSGGWSAWDNIGSTIHYGSITFAGTYLDVMYLVAGTHGVDAYDGNVTGNLLTLSGASILNDITGWTFAKVGGIPVLNHPEIGAYYWYPLSLTNPLDPLPFDLVGTPTYWNTATLQKSAKVIRSHKNFLFMLNLTEVISSVTQVFIDGYRWSHPAENNGIPVTWDETNQYYLAGFAQLGADGGNIVDGLSLGDMFVIYSEKAINVLELTGDVFVWSKRLLTNTLGLLSKNCVVEAENKHFFLSANEAYTTDGYGVKPLMHKRIKTHYTSHLNTGSYDNAFVVLHKAFKEVWFCVPTLNSDTPNLTYIYNYIDDSWAIKDIPTTSLGGVYGSMPTGIITWNLLATKSIPPSWAAYNLAWGASVSNLTETILTIQEDGTLYNIDPESSFGDFDALTNGSLDTFIERTNLNLTNDNQATTIVNVYPHMSGTTPVLITIGSHDYAGSPIRWNDPIEFTPSVSRKLDLRTTGILHAWRVESIGDGRFTFSGMSIEFVPAGQR